jgi:hypothetical protein
MGSAPVPGTQCPISLTRQQFPVPLDRDQVAQDRRKRGYFCDVFIDQPGREWNDFVHATNELMIVVTGNLRLIINAGLGDRAIHR